MRRGRCLSILACAAVVGLCGGTSASHAQKADDIWLLEIKRGAASLEFGGRSDVSAKQLAYLIQSFSCDAKGRGRIYLNEGLPHAWMAKNPKGPIAGKRTFTVETAKGEFSLQADVLNNEEAGTPGLEAVLTRSQMRSIVESPGQVHIRSGTFRMRVGLRGLEPHRETFLKVCG